MGAFPTDWGPGPYGGLTSPYINLNIAVNNCLFSDASICSQLPPGWQDVAALFLDTYYGSPSAAVHRALFPNSIFNGEGDLGVSFVACYGDCIGAGFSWGPEDGFHGGWGEGIGTPGVNLSLTAGGSSFGGMDVGCTVGGVVGATGGSSGGSPYVGISFGGSGCAAIYWKRDF